MPLDYFPQDHIVLPNEVCELTMEDFIVKNNLNPRVLDEMVEVMVSVLFSQYEVRRKFAKKMLNDYFADIQRETQVGTQYDSENSHLFTYLKMDRLERPNWIFTVTWDLNEPFNEEPLHEEELNVYRRVGFNTRPVQDNFPRQ